MGKGRFGIVCLVLAVLFSLAAVKGMINDNFSPVLVVPAIVAVALVLVGIRNFKSST